MLISCPCDAAPLWIDDPFKDQKMGRKYPLNLFIKGCSDMAPILH
ncbi:hypothetical protein SynROS8604_01321 [Synechococcus sp. ROS8604]|nr:hypothetical protein SynROS8604_01321 [Synechococcus sp. ROS8604]